MNFIYRIEDAIFAPIDRLLDGAVMTTFARLIFFAVLAVFFWNSGMTKLGDGISGIWSPSVGPYAQILPKSMEAVGFDPSQLSGVQRLIVLLGTWGEFIFPALIVIGFFTRPAALAMIGFIIVMSIVDIFGHNSGPETIGSWFDKTPYSIILDQRVFWIFLLLYLVMRGGGPLSVDALLQRRRDEGY